MNTSRKVWPTALALALAAFAAILLVMVPASQPARAAGPWYVAPGGSDGNDCLDSGPTHACASINGALGKATAGDTILVATGTYTGTGDQVVLLDKDVTLSGGWNSDFTAQSSTSTIDGEGARRGITVNSGVVATIERFNVRNGLSTGGGIYNHGALTVNNSAISDNRTTSTAGNGGGICNDGTLTLNNSAVSNNVAVYGGGIYNYGTVALNNSTVSSNGAGYGGGIFNYSGTITLSNGTFSGNEAISGGGIYTSIGTATLQNTILAKNTASSSSDCLGFIDSAGYNLVGDTSGCNFTSGVGDLTDVDAHLGLLIGAPGTPRYHPLLSGSPAINAGNPAGCTGSTGPLAADQRGVARVGRCDIGAYEHIAPGPATSIYAFDGTPQRGIPFSPPRIPLQVAVLDNIGSPVNSVTVAFSAPAGGASGIFTDTGTFTATAVTAEDGIATAATYMANGLLGSYTVTATVSGIATPAIFLLDNILWWYVTPDGNDDNTCASAGAACATVNGVLEKAGFFAGDTVLVASGTYTGTGSTVVRLGKDAILSGGWNSNFTAQSGTSIIDGQGTRRGIFVSGGVTATVEYFNVQNSLDSGINSWGTLTLNNSAVSNSVAVFGGGIYNLGTLTMNNSTVNNNTANEDGGGIHNLGTLTMNNSTVSGNSAGEWGGGICSYGAVALNNSTISGNTAMGTSGGIQGTVTLQNTILAGNTSGSIPDCFGTINSAGYNLVRNIAGCTFIPGTGDLTSVDANLGQLSGPTGAPRYHPLLPDSPAINAGNPAGCIGSAGPLTTDQRGLPRLGRCDIGAYEMQPIGFSTKTASQLTASPGFPLTYTIVLTNPGAADLTDVRVTDTLPIFLTYIDDSLSAISGSYGYNDGVITWTGAVKANNAVAVSFGAIAGPTLGVITNSAVISDGEEMITRTATVIVENQICNLTKYPGNPVLSAGPSGSWDDDDVWSLAVLKEGGGYKMWYTGDDGTNPSRIGLATSTDGITWTKVAANPVLSPGPGWEAGGIRAGSVISDSGLYRMWYTGFDSDGAGAIGYATSPDGIIWTKYGSTPVLNVGTPGRWEDYGVIEPTVIKEGGTYHMWYRGYDGITSRIGHATSSNGTAWTKDPANPVLDIGSPGGWDWLGVYGPSVMRYNDMFLMWYTGQALPEAWQTGYALSSDGSAWTRGKMLIPEGAAGTFDADSADYPSVIADGDQFKVWYSGQDASGTYNIGYATAEVCSAAAPPSDFVYLPIVLQGGCPAYYADDFSDSSSGWSIDDNSVSRYAYTDGQYQIWVKNKSYLVSTTPGAQATDFTAAVSARRASGSRGGYGIVFGIDEGWAERYMVLIDVNTYSIWKRSGGSWTPLQNWTASSYIKTGTAWNRLKVIRSGAGIAVYVNDHYLTTVTDSSYTGLRRIGLVASPSGSPLDARFDDFALYPAECGVSAAGAGFEMGKPETHEEPVPPGLDRAP